MYSARYAGENCNAEDNIQKVLKILKGEDHRAAKFRTVIALIVDGETTIFQGECQGCISNTKSGLKGFGYDPIFIPDGFNISFAEMDKAEKGLISHRGKAVKKLVQFLNSCSAKKD